MIKRLQLTFVFLFVATSVLFAGGSTITTVTNKCDTAYPVVLAHGMATNGDNINSYLTIKQALEAEGAEVYRTWVNAMDGHSQKAEQWRAEVLRILAVSGAQKVNVIAHSNGATYTRYAMSNLGMGSKVASWTGHAGPHRGSALADIVMGIIPGFAQSAVSWIVGLFYPGDENGNPAQNGIELTRNYMKNVFNPNVPDVSGIMYQSWAAKIKYPKLSSLVEITWGILLTLEGANDGIVSESSSKWGTYRGAVTGSWWGSGVNHFDIKSGLTVSGFDSSAFHVDLVNELKTWGY